ncbi:hypothetical protein BREVNS_0944 [Brevinematales bacterium NS]|nr:hypothetical protein BREVNS_0944 [Brevinematales bacterium NS]
MVVYFRSSFSGDSFHLLFLFCLLFPLFPYFTRSCSSAVLMAMYSPS